MSGFEIARLVAEVLVILCAIFFAWSARMSARNCAEAESDLEESEAEVVKYRGMWQGADRAVDGLLSQVEDLKAENNALDNAIEDLQPAAVQAERQAVLALLASMRGSFWDIREVASKAGLHVATVLRSLDPDAQEKAE